MKAFDGMPKGDAVAAVPRNMGHRLEECGAALAGSADALGVYIKAEPNPDYWDTKSLPGAIAGLLWLKPMPAGRGIRDFPEDAKYPLGWPLAAAAFEQGPDLKGLVRSLYPASPAAWENLCLELKGGKPFRIGRPPWSALGDELTRRYRHS
jgi:hypothetical protein